MDVWEKTVCFLGAFVNIHCVRIMNVVWKKLAEGLESHAEAVKISTLSRCFCTIYVEINALVFIFFIFSGVQNNNNNKVTVIFRNIFMAAASIPWTNIIII